MERFLIRCAEYIFNKHANHLQEVCIIFPNRRAGVFFNSYLQKQLTQPVIGPHVTTINEFISGYSDLHQGEKLLLISELFSIYKEQTHTSENFDDFYFWGEVLLADFSDIDHYLSDAKDLFTNVSDLKDIDQLFDYLTQDQKAALTRFWGSVSSACKKANHEKFLSVWSQLYPVYAGFKQTLEKKGIAYTGMIYRQVAERFRREQPELDFRKYYVVGLNALNSCEKVIFKAIGYKTDFLWDYDDFYLKDLKNEAGKFLRENLKQFPPPEDFNLDSSSFSGKKSISLVAVPSAYGQAQEVSRFLKEHDSQITDEFDNCAVVLADESLLYPALGAIPEGYESINVTMGYPVKNSVVFGFLLLLINLIKNQRKTKDGESVAYHRFVTDVLNHQLLVNFAAEQTRQYLAVMRRFNTVSVPLNDINFSELHRLIFTLPDRINQYSRYFLDVLAGLYKMTKELEPANQLLPELIHAIYMHVEKVEKLITDLQQEQGREVSNQLYFRLFTQYVGQASVAFDGEPVHGMQVMGILETRCLDFENLIILGLNENKWPRTFSAPSFIPYNIRKGFGLPGIDEQDAMYAYYFFRLAQRAKNIRATYSTIREGIGSGELSRYGFQLLYGSNLPVRKSTLDFKFFNDPAPPVRIKGTAAMTSALLSRNSAESPLSPTAINMWLQCRLRFYFRYVLQLAEPDEMKDEIDSPVFGSIFHETIENLYRPLVGKTVTRSDLEQIKNNKVLIENEIAKAIGKHYFRQKTPGKVRLEGRTILINENIKIFLQRLFEVDMKLVPFELVMLEEKVTAPILIPVNGKLQEIYLGGVIDRVDKVNGNLRIIDYKTGNVESFSLQELEELFEKDKDKPKKEILQALTYCLIYKKKNPSQNNLNPAVYSLRRLFEENFDPALKMNKNPLIYQDIETEFSEKLQELVAEIFSTANEYAQTPHEKNCQYCAYNKICQRF